MQCMDGTSAVPPADWWLSLSKLPKQRRQKHTYKIFIVSIYLIYCIYYNISIDFVCKASSCYSKQNLYYVYLYVKLPQSSINSLALKNDVQNNCTRHCSFNCVTMLQFNLSLFCYCIKVLMYHPLHRCWVLFNFSFDLWRISLFSPRFLRLIHHQREKCPRWSCLMWCLH